MSTAAVVIIMVLALILLVTVYVAAVAIRELFWLREDLQQACDNEHAKCMGAVMKFVGDEFAAQVLAVAADDYASAAEQNNLDRIRRLVYEPDGPPVPTLWLHERADRLRIMAVAKDERLDEVVGA